MDAKLNHSDLSALLAKHADISVAKSELFSKTFFELIIEGLEQEGIVKINGLGTFKMIDVASRSSVNVNTGEKFEIKGHKKLTFIPADTLKDKVNKPFAIFEPVEIIDEYTDDAECNDDECASDDVYINEAESTNSVTDSNIIENEQPVVISPEQQNDITTESLPDTISQQENKTENLQSEAQEKAPHSEGSRKNHKYAIISLLTLAVLLLCGAIYYSNKNTFPVSDGKPTADKLSVDTQQQSGESSDTVNNQQQVIEDEPESYKFKLIDQLAQQPLSVITLKDTLLYSADGQITTHRVGADETLTKISHIYYNDKRLWPYIVKYNNMSDHNRLAIGMELIIPKLKPVDNPQR